MITPNTDLRTIVEKGDFVTVYYESVDPNLQESFGIPLKGTFSGIVRDVFRGDIEIFISDRPRPSDLDVLVLYRGEIIDIV